ncbi:McrC family protein [Williamsia sp. MIQD14]|uniref:McrC family protein n=1 Tax=Williamsia sp. MIQD14 TaxID=3425703 RepID=UPI003DA0124E
MAKTPLILIEGGPARSAHLSLTEYEALRSLTIVDVAPTLEPGLYSVSAGRKIGAVSFGDMEVIVRPKIADLNRLVFLLGYSLHRDIWRDDQVRLTQADDLLPALAEAFSRLGTSATEQGLLQGYRTIRDLMPVVRGRILAGEQMSRRYGLPVPLAVEYDDYTVDIAENRLLLAAAHRLLSVPGVSPAARRRLQRLRISLADVTTLARGAAQPAWAPSRLNSRYHNALRLAEIVLAAQSFEHRAGELYVTGFMFDMWKVFEDFVCVALSDAIKVGAGRVATQLPIYLDGENQVRMKPDLTVLGSRGEVKAVFDAKYKAERPEGFPNADVYQMLAYCTVTGLPDGHLVYAKGNEYPVTYAVRNSKVVVHCHALDLSLKPSDLIAQIVAIADLAVRREQLK